jgi:hypothetical protein
MGAKDDDGLGNVSPWMRVVFIACLSSGGISGYSALNQGDTSDRYHRTQAVSDFALRDNRIKRNEQEIERLRVSNAAIRRRIQEESREAEEDLKAHLKREKHRPE